LRRRNEEEHPLYHHCRSGEGRNPGRHGAATFAPAGHCRNLPAHCCIGRCRLRLETRWR